MDEFSPDSQCLVNRYNAFQCDSIAVDGNTVCADNENKLGFILNAIHVL